MNTPLNKNQSVVDGVWLGAASIALLVLIIFINIHLKITTLTSEDDLHFAYYSAAKIVDADRHDEMTNVISRFLKTEADAPHDSFRFDERNRVAGNYPILSHVIAWVRTSMLDAVYENKAPYPQTVSRIFNASLHLNALLILLVFSVPLFFVHRSLILGAAIGICIILLVNWFFPWKVPPWVLHVRPQNFSEVIERFFQTLNLVFTAGGSAGGLESIFPRGNFIALTAPIFLLRWSRRYSASYAMVVVSCLVHLSMGALLMLSLLASDFILRRDVLRSPTVLVIVSGIIGWFVSSPLFMNSLGIPASVPTSIAFLVAGLTSFIALKSFIKITLPSRLDTAIARIRKTGPIASDLIALYAIWLAIIPIALFMYFSAGEARNPWTWGELPGRYLMIMNTPLIIGASIMAVHFVRKHGRTFDPMIKFGVLLVVTGMFSLNLQKPDVFENTIKQLLSGIEVREQTVSQVENGNVSEYVEADVYYAVARAIDLKRPFPKGLLTYTPNACASRKSICE